MTAIQGSTKAGLFFLGFVLCQSIIHAEEPRIHLFDGKSLSGWTTEEGKPVTKGWAVEDGLLVCTQRGGAIYTEDEYGDFDLRFQWKIAKRGNSGVKYRVAFYPKGLWGNPGWLGCEYQLFDDSGRSVSPQQSAGALYGLYEPNDRKQLKPIGEFNDSRIVVRGTKIEHWLNGEKIVAADTSSDDWQKRVAQSKFNQVENIFKNPKGRIQLQDHGSKVWFREITIRVLDESM
ncbi:MAG: DUF1080 domain-containing protein [Pirellulales bacterium]|nr:DUF1080 domain-containing protein [Pirellulales bacterium]